MEHNFVSMFPMEGKCSKKRPNITTKYIYGEGQTEGFPGRILPRMAVSKTVEKAICLRVDRQQLGVTRAETMQSDIADHV